VFLQEHFSHFHQSTSVELMFLQEHFSIINCHSVPAGTLDQVLHINSFFAQHFFVEFDS